MLVVSSNLTSTHGKHFFKEKSEFPHVTNLTKYSPWAPRNIAEPRVGDASTRISGLDLNIPPFQGGGCYQA